MGRKSFEDNKDCALKESQNSCNCAFALEKGALRLINDNFWQASS